MSFSLGEDAGLFTTILLLLLCPLAEQPFNVSSFLSRVPESHSETEFCQSFLIQGNMPFSWSVNTPTKQSCQDPLVPVPGKEYELSCKLFPNRLYAQHNVKIILLFELKKIFLLIGGICLNSFCLLLLYCPLEITVEFSLDHTQYSNTVMFFYLHSLLSNIYISFQSLWYSVQMEMIVRIE